MFTKSKRGTDAATLFVQKGWDNIYLLTGGMAAFGNTYPQLLTGPLPAHLVAKEAKASPIKASKSDNPKLTAANIYALQHARQKQVAAAKQGVWN